VIAHHPHTMTITSSAFAELLRRYPLLGGAAT